MEVRNGLARSIAQVKRDYDSTCKLLLAEPQLRARILQAYVPEFGGMPLAEVEALLGDDVEVGTQPVEGRGTAREASVEDVAMDEGTAWFDVRFSVEVPGGGARVVVEIDLEAQSRWSVGYPLASRAVFYCARMVSAQGRRVLPRSEYGRLHKVYSIWVCSHPDAAHRGTVQSVCMQPRGAGDVAPLEGYDLMEACFVCLDPAKADAAHGCLGLLSAIFAREGDPAALRRELAGEFGMMMTEEIDERVEAMCNFSEGVWEEGKAEGKAEALRSLMANLGLSLETAMEALGIPAGQRPEYERLVAALG